MEIHWDLLLELSTDEQPHLRDSLFEHLKGTHALLAAWGNPEQVCAAGLFHSIYGTESYRHESANLDQRQRIAAAIGARAEQLAYLFCSSKRDDFFTASQKTGPTLLDRFTGATRDVSRETLAALVEMEVANALEQYRYDSAPGHVVRWIRHMLRKGGHLMSPAARTALTEFSRNAAIPGAGVDVFPPG